MNIDKFKQQDGTYLDEDGCTYQSAVEFIQTGMLEMCACGMPERNLEFVRDGLAHIDSLRETWAQRKEYSAWVNEGNQLFGSERGRYFFYYWAASLDLTEHGGSVPGWLTPDGIDLLADLREIDLVEAANL